MSVSPHPKDALSAFDTAARAFADDCARHVEGGRAVASADADRLWRLAHRIAADLSVWTDAHKQMDAAVGGAFPPGACGHRLVEALFDDALTPCATRVLSSALDVALSGAIKSPAAPDGRA